MGSRLRYIKHERGKILCRRLELERGAVSGRVSLFLRSAEAKPFVLQICFSFERDAFSFFVAVPTRCPPQRTWGSPVSWVAAYGLAGDKWRALPWHTPLPTRCLLFHPRLEPPYLGLCRFPLGARLSSTQPGPRPATHSAIGRRPTFSLGARLTVVHFVANLGLNKVG